MTLAEFLLARIAEDESRARACNEWPECGPANWEAETWAHETDPDGDHVDGTYGCEAHPSVRRLLAECGAKRRLVEAFGDMLDWHGSEQAAAEFVLGALATVYADHPDYRQEWKL